MSTYFIFKECIRKFELKSKTKISMILIRFIVMAWDIWGSIIVTVHVCMPRAQKFVYLYIFGTSPYTNSNLGYLLNDNTTLGINCVFSTDVSLSLYLFVCSLLRQRYSSVFDDNLRAKKKNYLN